MIDKKYSKEEVVALFKRMENDENLFHFEDKGDFVLDDWIAENVKEKVLNVAKLDIAFRILYSLSTYHNNEYQVQSIRFDHNCLCVKIKEEIKLCLEDKFDKFDNVSFTKLADDTFLVEWHKFEV